MSHHDDDAPTLDRAALERLYVEMEARLVNVVYRWVWDMDAARDVVQDAFVRLWDARERVRLQTVEAYLYRIALNGAAKRRRWHKVRGFVGLEAVRARASDDVPADIALLGSERAARVRAAVEALPEKHRRVVMLCELAELSYAEVAAILGVAEGTVASRRHHALRRLRAALADEGP